MNLSNKRGSFTIFVTMAFAAILIMVFAVINVSIELAVGSTTEHFGRLWGRSVLAEYDRRLKDRYGLIGFYGNEYEVGKKLDFYADYTFKDKPYIKFENDKCSLEGFSLTENDVFVKQIEEIVTCDVKPVVRDYAGYEEGSTCNRKITSRLIINGLPSGGKDGGISIFSLVEKIKSEMSISGIFSQAAENIYIFRFYKDCMNERELGKTYFNNEIEYIISGKPDDIKAKKALPVILSR